LHEEEYVSSLRMVSVDASLSEQEAEKKTIELMQKGVNLIYQGAISYKSGNVKFKGRPDLLEKCEGGSKFGNYFYIPIEIKNSGKCEKPEYKMQLMFYGMILEKIQGYFPKEALFINRDKKRLKCPLTIKLLEKTTSTIDDILDIFNGTEPPLNINSKSKQTPWFDVLMDEAKSRQDIALLYNVKSDILESLREQGIKTLKDMALVELNNLPEIKGAGAKTLARAQSQAKSLIENKIVLSHAKVPNSDVKIYFDIEGDPFLKVEYLFGFWVVDGRNPPYFKYFLAEQPADEEKMWNNFLAWLEDSSFSNYKVYHYHHYEKTNVNKLTKKYGGSQKLDEFMNNLVDLSKIVIQSIIFPVYFYSIKDLAKKLNFKWQHQKAGGAQSIFWYEKWLETNNREVLQDIINYNEDDVKATEFLHTWLLDNC
jgi:predicted RecB family nuclease